MGNRYGSEEIDALPHSFEKERLLVIIPDVLSHLVKKGEITERYYNPGELFKEVHILMTNNDAVAPEVIQKTVGRAKLFIHSLPVYLKLFITSAGWQPMLMGPWIQQGLDIAAKIKPDMVRTHNNFLEGFLAKRIKDYLGVPYVTSLHGVWDRDCLNTFSDKFFRFFRKKLEKITLRNADGIIAVYKPIIRYAKAHGAKDVRLIYNVVAGKNIEPKSDYGVSGVPRLLTVNRQLKEKNPENIIRAIRDIDCRYVIFGDGEYHQYLKHVAGEAGCTDKVEFIPAIANDRLCGMLKDFDMMVSHCDYWGISKTVIEGALAGLPIVLNRHPAAPIPDLEGDWLMLCENTVEGYRCAISALLNNGSLRTEYGRRAYLHAKEQFDPDVMEKKTIEFYLHAMSSSRVVPGGWTS